MSPKYSKGFSLIELLVVTGMIALLASFILASLQDARLDAQYAKARTEIKQIEGLMLTAKVQKKLTIAQLSGTYCTECACRNVGSLRDLPTSHACTTTYLSTMAKLNSSTDGIYTFKTIPKDPWGSPYLINENEGETGYPGGTCYTDSIASAGPNGLYYDTDDVVHNVQDTICSPVTGVHHPDVNWIPN